MIVIALGANLSTNGQPPTTSVKNAMNALNSGPLSVVAKSRLFSTPCFPAGAGPDYVNACVRIETALDPEAVLERLHEIEAQAGRVRGERWGMRVLDLDLITYGDVVLPDLAQAQKWIDLPPEQQIGAAPEGLVLPHPRLQDRAFVLVPMAEVAPDWKHPILKKTVSTLKGELSLSETGAVVPI